MDANLSFGWLLTNLAAAALLPPLNGLLLLVGAWISWRKRPRLARTLLALGVILLWLLATPLVARYLLQQIQTTDPVSPEACRQARAIVVLGGGRHHDAREYRDSETVSKETLIRLRYAARLHRETGLPLLVSGGKPDGGELSEAETMRRVLRDDFLAPPRWLETQSDNTQENARFSADLLQAEGIQHVLLVTEAWHMPRALRSFASVGLTAYPAPTYFQEAHFTLLDYLPKDYRLARQAIHEGIGLLWYRLRYGA